jgi:hypothetical protein
MTAFRRGQAVVHVGHHGGDMNPSATALLRVARVTARQVVTSDGERWTRDGQPWRVDDRRGDRPRPATDNDAREYLRRDLAARLARVRWNALPLDALRQAAAAVPEGHGV